MLTRRIIPCLDIHQGKVVKGINFENVREVGDPIALATRYADEGADELCFLDISATHEGRKTTVALVREVARVLNIPFTVGGGISSLADAAALLEAGCDKVSVNSAAVRRPELIGELADHFGSQFVVLAIDAKQLPQGWAVHLAGGREATTRGLFEWAAEGVARGCGEILFTSMDHDGVKQGYALEATRQLAKAVSVPVIASGGAGAPEHFAHVLAPGGAEAALAASLFHYGQLTLPDLKLYLAAAGIPVRTPL